MSFIEHKTVIDDAYRHVSRFSFEEKRNPQLTEQHINAFLDAILDLKSLLREKTNKLNEVTLLFEKLTWYNNLDDDCLMRINETISLAKELYRSLSFQYASLARMRIKSGIVKEEIQRLKTSLDDLKEIITDVENVFFVLPADDEFVNTTKELNLL